MQGGKTFSELPNRAKDGTYVILTIETWQQLLSYIEKITPRGDGKTISVQVTPTGSIIKRINA